MKANDYTSRWIREANAFQLSILAEPAFELVNFQVALDPGARQPGPISEPLRPFIILSRELWQRQKTKCRHHAFHVKLQKAARKNI